MLHVGAFQVDCDHELVTDCLHFFLSGDEAGLLIELSMGLASKCVAGS